MNYQDLLKLKKGDQIRFFHGSGWTEGEVTGSQAGAEPALWVSITPGTEVKVHTGANFTEDAWYRFKLHTLIEFADQVQEDVSMEWVRGQ